MKSKVFKFLPILFINKCMNTKSDTKKLLKYKNTISTQSVNKFCDDKCISNKQDINKSISLSNLIRHNTSPNLTENHNLISKFESNYCDTFELKTFKNYCNDLKDEITKENFKYINTENNENLHIKSLEIDKKLQETSNEYQQSNSNNFEENNSTLSNTAQNEDVVINVNSERLFKKDIKSKQTSFSNDESVENVTSNLYNFQNDVKKSNENINSIYNNNLLKEIRKMFVGLLCFTLFGFLCIMIVFIFFNSKFNNFISLSFKMISNN